MDIGAGHREDQCRPHAARILCQARGAGRHRRSQGEAGHGADGAPDATNTHYPGERSTVDTPCLWTSRNQPELSIRIGAANLYCSCTSIWFKQSWLLFHIVQASATEFTHSTPETATFRLETAPASATEDSLDADVSFMLCNQQSAASPASPAAPAAVEHPGSRSLLQELSQQLADAERPSDGGGHEVRCTLRLQVGSAACFDP